jgi:hypothetical protein
MVSSNIHVFGTNSDIIGASSIREGRAHGAGGLGKRWKSFSASARSDLGTGLAPEEEAEDF